MKHLYLNTYLSGKLFLFLLLLFVSLPSYSQHKIYRWYSDGVSVLSSGYDLAKCKATIIYGSLNTTGKVSTESEIGAGQFKIKFDFTQYPGYSLFIDFKELHAGYATACGNAQGRIPVIVKSSKKLSELTLPTNINETDIYVCDGQTLTMDVTNDDFRFNNLIIRPNAKVIVPDDKKFFCKQIQMFVDEIEDKYPQLIMKEGSKIGKYNDGEIDQNLSPLLYVYHILDYSKYYPFFLPYPILFHASTSPYGLLNFDTNSNAEYEVQYYDGNKRISDGTGWMVFTPDASHPLEQRKGYIIFAVPRMWNTTRRQNRAIIYGNNIGGNSLFHNGVYNNISVAVTASGDESTPANDRNWNLIGNPYLSTIRGTAIDNESNAVFLKWKDLNGDGLQTDGTTEDEGVKYITLPLDGFRRYKQVRTITTEAEVKPFNVFFVQTNGAGYITFDRTKRKLSIPSRNANSQQQEISLDLVLKQDTLSDNAGLLFGSRYTDEYDLNGDLQKMFGDLQGLSLYSVHNSLQHAFLALPSDTTQVTLGFSYADTGKPLTLTLDTLTNNLQWKSVWLTDLRENITVDLLLEDYTFTTSSPHDDHRFILDAVAAEKAPSALEELVTSQQQYTDGIYDILGRRLDNAHLTNGVYIVVENGKPRKTVIR